MPYAAPCNVILGGVSTEKPQHAGRQSAPPRIGQRMQRLSRSRSPEKSPIRPLHRTRTLWSGHRAYAGEREKPKYLVSGGVGGGAGVPFSAPTKVVTVGGSLQSTPLRPQMSDSSIRPVTQSLETQRLPTSLASVTVAGASARSFQAQRGQLSHEAGPRGAIQPGVECAWRLSCGQPSAEGNGFVSKVQGHQRSISSYTSDL